MAAVSLDAVIVVVDAVTVVGDAPIKSRSTHRCFVAIFKSESLLFRLFASVILYFAAERNLNN